MRCTIEGSGLGRGNLVIDTVDWWLVGIMIRSPIAPTCTCTLDPAYLVGMALPWHVVIYSCPIWLGPGPMYEWPFESMRNKCMYSSIHNL